MGRARAPNGIVHYLCLCSSSAAPDSSLFFLTSGLYSTRVHARVPGGDRYTPGFLKQDWYRKVKFSFGKDLYVSGYIVRVFLIQRKRKNRPRTTLIFFCFDNLWLVIYFFLISLPYHWSQIVFYFKFHFVITFLIFWIP